MIQLLNMIIQSIHQLGIFWIVCVFGQIAEFRERLPNSANMTLLLSTGFRSFGLTLAWT